MSETPDLSGLFIGTSDWSYAHWKEVFYPVHLKPAEYLEFYLTRFSCVELNSCFYHIPRKSTVEGWMRRTPGSFRFCLKLSRLITHQKLLVDCHEALERFFGVFEPMRERLGPVLIQIPPGLTFDLSLISDFLNLLEVHYRQFGFAVEVRHGSWINDQFFGLLARHGIAFVIADSNNRFPYDEAVTSGSVYLRLHGPGSLYASEYDESALRRYAEKILNWLGSGHRVWVFFNNDFNGYAVRNALNLNELVHSIS